MKQHQYSLDGVRRASVFDSICEVCLYRGWNELAAHVRMNHVHVIVEAEVKAEKAMNDCKAYANRGLNRLRLDATERRRWAHHGSTRWLSGAEAVKAAIRYVVEEQGERMALFVGDFA